MKRLSLIFVVMLTIGTLYTKAQNYANMNLQFAYIAHDISTPVTKLCGKLDEMREDADDVGGAFMVYLSNSKQPYIYLMNLRDKSNNGRDKLEAFKEIRGAMQDANSHLVVAQDDIDNLITLFDEFNFVDAEGNIRFRKVTLDFYVGADFWSLGNNEKVIAHLYHDFGMANLPADKFVINIYMPKSDLEKVQKPLFGNANVNGINDKVKLFSY